jgi:hypothetical protein
MTDNRPRIATFAIQRLRDRARAQEHAQEELAMRLAKQGRRQLVVIAALIGALLAVTVAGFLILGSRTGTASLAAQHFCDALVAQDYATAYADLSLSVQREGTETQFAASQSMLDQLHGRATTCTFTGARVDSAGATFTLRVTRAGSGAASGTLRMIMEHGDWKVSDYDANVV